MGGAALGRMRSWLARRIRGIFVLAPFERPLLAYTRGRPYEGLAKLVPLPESYPPGTMRAATRHGCNLNLDLSDLIDWYVFWGFLDPSHEAIVDQCGPGATVLDVGANRGSTAIRLALAAGPSGRVIALEPDPTNYEILRERLRSNGLTWATPLNVAAAERPATLRIAARARSNSGMHQVSETGAEVRAARLDDIVEELNLSEVDLIKIDVEGYEARVIEGAGRTIAEHRPTLIIEIDAGNLATFGATPSGLLDHVRGLGYRITDSVSGASELPDRQFDALAVPSGGRRRSQLNRAPRAGA